MAPDETEVRSGPEPGSPEGASSRVQSLFAEFLLAHPDHGTAEFEELCAAHPVEAGALRKLRAVQQLVLLAGPVEASTAPPHVPGFSMVRRLGAGGMGEVWEAVEVALERRVAVKLTPRMGSDSARELERWRRETLAAGRLRHPNAVALYSAGESAGRCFLVQELVAGGRTLRDEIEDLRRSGQVPAAHDRRSAERFARLADALQAAHDAGVVHRDVKPQNILIEPDGTPKLADFGLALLSGTTSLSLTGEFVGTYLYASPEQVGSDRGAVGPASDVFGLGATLYECLTLERPFAGDDVPSIVRHILRDDPADPRSFRPRIPRELAMICLMALEKSPDRRYASAADLRDDLRRFLRNEPTRARPPSLARRAQKWIARHPTAAATGGLSLAAFLAILALYLESERRADDLALSNRLLISANEQREKALDRARSEADVSREVETFLASLFQAVDPSLIGTGNPDLRQLVDRGTRRLHSGEITDARVRARLTCQLGLLQARLGNWELARQLLQESVDLWHQLGELDTPQAMEARTGLGSALADLGRNEEAEALLIPLVERWHQGVETDPANAFPALVRLAASFAWSGRIDEAEVLLEEAQRLLPESGTGESQQVRALTVARAEAAFLSGRFERCAQLLEPVCEDLEPLLAAGNTVALEAFNLRAMLLRAQGRAEESAALLERVLPLAEDSLGAAHPRAINARTNLASAWMSLARIDEAEAILLENAELAEAALGEGSKEAVSILINLGSLLTFRRELEGAEETLERAIDLSLEQRGPDHMHTRMARSALAICYFQQGRAAEAAELQDLVLRSLPEDFADREQMEGALAIYRRAAAATPP